jgi:hypothetical protein
MIANSSSQTTPANQSDGPRSVERYLAFKTSMCTLFEWLKCLHQSMVTVDCSAESGRMARTRAGRSFDRLSNLAIGSLGVRQKHFHSSETSEVLPSMRAALINKHLANLINFMEPIANCNLGCLQGHDLRKLR